MTNRYRASLVKIMLFKDDCHYAAGMAFIQEELLRINPDDICRWMNAEPYGSTAPTEEMEPLNARSSTFYFVRGSVCIYATCKRYIGPN